MMNTRIRFSCVLPAGEFFERASEGEEKPGAWMRDLIQVMTYQEILRRRSEHRSRRRKFY